jgi:SpoIID/LytB domain protein
MPRAIMIVVCIGLCSLGAPAMAQSPAPSATPLPPPQERVVFTGAGSAHGLGMAMDGVEGQARAGWSHAKILSLFYPGTFAGRAYGTIRVGIAVAPRQFAILPRGGTVTDAAGAFRVTVRPGGGIAVTPDHKRLLVRIRQTGVGGPPAPRPSTKPATKPQTTPTQTARPGPLSKPGGSGIVPPPPPLPTPTPTPRRPSPAPSPVATATPSVLQMLAASSSVMVTPFGTPALTTVGATGHRYRGTIEFHLSKSGVGAINHVSLDDYVSGIAEEKGQSWPDEGLKALAVAARSLGYAAMTWLDAHHVDGYDICSTGNCQLYLGYDYEDASMRSAALQTAGEIRTYSGKPIMAMYHGNGGGQTDSYKALSNSADDPYPYLRSIKYPYADPWHWRVVTSFSAIESALTKDKVTVPTPLKYVVVLKRGESPRVVRVGLFGNTTRGIALNGFAFSRAIGLPSSWFNVQLPYRTPRSLSAAFLTLGDDGDPVVPAPRRAFPWTLSLLAGFLAVAAAAGNWAANGGARSISAWMPPRLAAPAWLRRGLSTRVLRRPGRVGRTPAADASATG